MKILIINGPNLNLLGKRETQVYGNQSFEEYFEGLKQYFSIHEIGYFQTNVEGEIINRLHSAMTEYDAVVLNPGGYAHTSVAIRDAIAAITIPVVEVHISNVYSREEFRKNMLTAAVSKGCVTGFGLKGYSLAIQSLIS
ncbi:MAG: type II 3-dehydroquinate dehydratase [Bacteroidales bacterium]|nr:type II 3-dehydroquinate dehydratase [Bacteroidales bacterium]